MSSDLGSAASVPVLASQAGRPRVATLAIDALFAIPGPESEAALLDLLGSTQGPALVTVMEKLVALISVSAIPPAAITWPTFTDCGLIRLVSR